MKPTMALCRKFLIEIEKCNPKGREPRDIQDKVVNMYMNNQHNFMENDNETAHFYT